MTTIRHAVPEDNSPEINWSDYPDIPAALDTKRFKRSFPIGNTRMWQEIGEGRLKVTRIGRKVTIAAADAIRWYERYRRGEG